MNKTIVYTALLTFLSYPAFSEEAPTPATPVESIQQTHPASAPQQSIDCDYKISAETTEIDPDLIKTWSKSATVQAFSFNSAAMNTQLENLKKCFTDQGWKGFYEALEQSGNIKAIQSQNLTVSSQVDGTINLTPAKENQWKLTVPLEVVYQNGQQKLTQLLSIDVLVGRKVSGDLGIMQMIATPRVAGQPQENGPAEPSATPVTDPAMTQPVSVNNAPE